MHIIDITFISTFHSKLLFTCISKKKKEKYFEYAIQYLYLKKGKLKLANSHLFNFLNFSVFVNPKQPLQESSRFCTPWYM